ncbi:hypothetical protein [Hymenobacter setariae]|uniref:hypothetical protein n=1 Tax=Hymenobacter setariae TaxID=2594794 RepID=UPI001F1EA51B|nr:hypothetical protein [Hymenobacter setariae]
MRKPTIQTDYWELRSAEASHAKYGDTFWIPALEARQTIARGQAARLLFDIEVDNEGEIDVVGERMWVIVKEKIGDTYIGILDNQPACLDFEDAFYLRLGAEVPFLAEHVIDIDTPPQDHSDWQLSLETERILPRLESACPLAKLTENPYLCGPVKAAGRKVFLPEPTQNALHSRFRCGVQ